MSVETRQATYLHTWKFLYNRLQGCCMLSLITVFDSTKIDDDTHSGHRSQWPNNKRIQMCLHFRFHSSHIGNVQQPTIFKRRAFRIIGISWKRQHEPPARMQRYVVSAWNQFNLNPIGFWPLLVQKNTCLIIFNVSAGFFILQAVLAKKEIVSTIDWKLLSSKNMQLVYFRLVYSINEYFLLDGFIMHVIQLEWIFYLILQRP